MATFGERLKIALKNKNIKQSQLAYKLNVDRSYITNWINEKYGISEETKKKIADYLDVSIAWLSGYDVPMTEKVPETFNLSDEEVVYHRDGKPMVLKLNSEQKKMFDFWVNSQEEQQRGKCFLERRLNNVLVYIFRVM